MQIGVTEAEPDHEAIAEAWWETYLEECEKTNTEPSFKDFKIWLEENTP